MTVLNKFFLPRTGEGQFYAKNMAEAISAQELLVWTDEELSRLHDGPGADDLWTHSHWERAPFVEAVRNVMKKIRKIEVVYGNSHRSANQVIVKLPFSYDDITEEVG